MTQLEIHYPAAPGCKTGGTSAEAAARAFDYSHNLRLDCWAELCRNDLTADEVATRLHKSVLAIRPRISELVAMGKLVRTTERRKNESGCRAIVWRAVLE